MSTKTMSTKTTNTKTPAPKPETEKREPATPLSHRYGSIGIQAVAAAARYGERRKSPAASRIDLRFVESAV
jgi:hypothetical protein